MNDERINYILSICDKIKLFENRRDGMGIYYYYKTISELNRDVDSFDPSKGFQLCFT